MNDVFESAPRRFARLVDSGSGRRVIHWLIFLLFAASMALLHARGTFQGLKSPRAMEEAQLARSLADGQGLSTHCLRPLSLWKLSDATGTPVPPGSHPDLLHPPVWPAVLSMLFRAVGGLAPQHANGVVDPCDYWPLAGAHLFAVLSVLWVWLIARRLFDARVGTLSAVSCLLCDLLWKRSGLADDFSCALFFLLGAVYFALCAAAPRRGTGPWPGGEPVPLSRVLPPLVLSSMCSALAFLSRYEAGAIELALVLHLGFSRSRPRPWVLAGLHLLLAVCCTIPWIVRNIEVCGSPFGLVPLAALSGTYLFPGDALARSLAPTLPGTPTAFYAIQLKTLANLRAFASGAAGAGGAGPLLALAVCACFHPFRRHASGTLRWCLLAAACIALFSSAVFAPSAAAVPGCGMPGAVLFFVPLAIPYGWAFFLVLLDRLRTPSRLLAAGATAAVLAASAWSFVLSVVPPRTGHPYPPYYHAYVDWTCNRLPAGGTIATDIPWATAWYGGVPSLLLPRDTADFAAIDRTLFRLPLVYLTTETRDRPWHSALAAPEAPDRSWYRLMSDVRIPADFPLQHARFIGGTDQLLLSSLPLD